MNIGKWIEYSLIPVGTALGIANIQEWLGVALLVLQICIVLTNIGISIYNKIKKGNIDGISDDLDKAEKAVKDVQDKIDGKGKEDKK